MCQEKVQINLKYFTKVVKTNLTICFIYIYNKSNNILKIFINHRLNFKMFFNFDKINKFFDCRDCEERPDEPNTFCIVSEIFVYK